MNLHDRAMLAAQQERASYRKMIEALLALLDGDDNIEQAHAALLQLGDTELQTLSTAALELSQMATLIFWMRE